MAPISANRWKNGWEAVPAVWLMLWCAGFGGLVGCTSSMDRPAVLRLATTTSTRDSGLLDVLLPVFEKSQECRVDVIAVGTGAALKLGEVGDVDAVLVHAREAEEAFTNADHGVRHEEFMVNHFVLLGPPDDPARIRDLDPPQAMNRIAEGSHPFISRGDDSGTHKKELNLWEEADGRPQWDDYIESGQGMGATLILADEKRAYVLADMGTYLRFHDKIELDPLVAEGAGLRNPYSIIVVNPDKHAKVNAALADALADFLVSAEAQRLIAGYQISGRQLFHPTRLDADR
jgi:tungstate transport system substrate-binding protein